MKRRARQSDWWRRLIDAADPDTWPQALSARDLQRHCAQTIGSHGITLAELPEITGCEILSHGQHRIARLRPLDEHRRIAPRPWLESAQEFWRASRCPQTLSANQVRSMMTTAGILVPDGWIDRLAEAGLWLPSDDRRWLTRRFSVDRGPMRQTVRPRWKPKERAQNGMC